MMSQKHIITTWVTLLSVLPGLLGLGTIMHYCNACNDDLRNEALYLSYSIEEVQSCGCLTTECSLQYSEDFSFPSGEKPCQSELANVKPVLTHVQTEELLPFLIEIDLLSSFYESSNLYKEESPNHFSKPETKSYSNFFSSRGALKQSVFGTFLL